MTDAPAFYALRGGGWRDWWSILHPPYTIWHLSYVALGAAIAPTFSAERMFHTLGAFFLAVGIGAHALDERKGHPLKTGIGDRTLLTIATISIAGAVAWGIYGVSRIGWTLIPFMVFGAFIVAAYNLEWFNGMFHSDLWFAVAWGAFPALVGFWVQATRFSWAGVSIAIACLMLSVAQRALSTPVRALRRRARDVHGEIVQTDGSTEPITKQSLMEPSEHALRALSAAMPALAAAAVLARW